MCDTHLRRPTAEVRPMWIKRRRRPPENRWAWSRENSSTAVRTKNGGVCVRRGGPTGRRTVRTRVRRRTTVVDVRVSRPICPRRSTFVPAIWTTRTPRRPYTTTDAHRRHDDYDKKLPFETMTVFTTILLIIILIII